MNPYIKEDVSKTDLLSSDCEWTSYIKKLVCEVGKGCDFNKIMIAGGSVIKCIDINHPVTDIDVFVCWDAEEKALSNLKDLGFDYSKKINRGIDGSTKEVYELAFNVYDCVSDNCSLQLISFRLEDVQDVFDIFDFVACCVGISPKHLIYHPDAIENILNRDLIQNFDVEIRPERIKKYIQKGFRYDDELP